MRNLSVRTLEYKGALKPLLVLPVRENIVFPVSSPRDSRASTPTSTWEMNGSISDTATKKELTLGLLAKETRMRDVKADMDRYMFFDLMMDIISA